MSDAPENTPKAPQIMINTQYVKDLSFENPSAPKSLLQQKEPPKVGINVDVQAYKITNDAEMYEVVLSIQASAKTGKETTFMAELLYAGVFTVHNADGNTLEQILLIECPRLLFPYARAVISDATRDGGFAPLMIHPIDFAGLYAQQKQASAGGSAIKDKSEATGGSDDGQKLASS